MPVTDGGLVMAGRGGRGWGRGGRGGTGAAQLGATSESNPRVRVFPSKKRGQSH